MLIPKSVSLGLIFWSWRFKFPAVYNFLSECPTRISLHFPDAPQPLFSPVFPTRAWHSSSHSCYFKTGPWTNSVAHLLEFCWKPRISGPTLTCWIRIYLLTKPPGSAYAQYNLRSTDLQLLPTSTHHLCHQVYTGRYPKYTPSHPFLLALPWVKPSPLVWNSVMASELSHSTNHQFSPRISKETLRCTAVNFERPCGWLDRAMRDMKLTCVTVSNLRRWSQRCQMGKDAKIKSKNNWEPLFSHLITVSVLTLVFSPKYLSDHIPSLSKVFQWLLNPTCTSYFHLSVHTFLLIFFSFWQKSCSSSEVLLKSQFTGEESSYLPSLPAK